MHQGKSMRSLSALTIALLLSTTLLTHVEARRLTRNITARSRHARQFQQKNTKLGAKTRQRTFINSSRQAAVNKAIKAKYPHKFTFLRRVVSLSHDPAHGKATPNSKREGYIGAALEAQNRLPGPITREVTGRSEFVDAKGQMWDVKGFNSNFAVKRGGFSLKKAIDKLRGEFAGGENVILDTRNLSTQHQGELKRAIKSKGWEKKVIWFP